MRLVIVSNRLPFTVVNRGEGLAFRDSSGGLASGLKAYLEWWNKQPDADHVWIGWPGARVRDDLKDQVRQKALSEHNSVPVFLDQDTVEKFYNGFCNSTIWPLFHYFPSQAKFEKDYWTHYKRANETFCNAVAKEVRPGDIVWIHDYQLMLLPQLLRNRIPEASIGFFLHIPFPSVEMVRLLPTEWRREIIEGLLGADLVGFHTVDYTHHFLQSALRVAGREHSLGEIVVEYRTVRADTFPIGVNIREFDNAVNSPTVRRHIASLRESLGDKKILFSTDRLDYTKGVGHRLEAYKTFLESNPQWRGKVVMVLSIVPSRLKAEGYLTMKDQIDKLVGEINGNFGGVSWTPILYQYKFLPFERLVALYKIADVCFVTPLRDGMNLVAKEYIATKKNDAGVLVLSEMAGAAKELGEAIIVNPNDTTEMAGALKTALEMPVQEQITRNQVMRSRLDRYDIIRWGQDFVSGVVDVKQEQGKFSSRLLDPKTRKQLVQDFCRASNRLLLLDYDGTLTPFKDAPGLAKPGMGLLKILGQITADPRNNLVIISSRDRPILEEWFGSLNMGLAAEYGAWLKPKGGEWHLTRDLTKDWKTKILPLLNTYVDRLPGSFVEEKEFSLAWHYLKADPELSSIRTKELMDELSDFLRNTELQVLQHSKVVEVKHAGINKAITARDILSKTKPDFVLAIGDTSVDEEMFSVLPKDAYSIRVGMVDSSARYNLLNSNQVLELLSDLSRTLEKDITA